MTRPDAADDQALVFVKEDVVMKKDIVDDLAKLLNPGHTASDEATHLANALLDLIGGHLFLLARPSQWLS